MHPMIDYRPLRFHNLTSPPFRHLLYLIYWPIYGIVFWVLERGLKLSYHTVYIPWDDRIPFCEFFIFPYYFWFIFLIGIHVYTLFFDIRAFQKLMIFIMITYTATSVIYMVYPTAQELRPIMFERENFCVDIVKFLYVFDTNTNVCPSLHVIGSFAVLFTSWSCPRFQTVPWKLAFLIATVLISISTVFLKQHSLLDIFFGILLCLIAYPFAFVLPDRRAKKQKISEA